MKGWKCVCVCVCVRERERERENEWKVFTTTWLWCVTPKEKGVWLLTDERSLKHSNFRYPFLRKLSQRYVVSYTNFYILINESWHFIRVYCRKVFVFKDGRRQEVKMWQTKNFLIRTWRVVCLHCIIIPTRKNFQSNDQKRVTNEKNVWHQNTSSILVYHFCLHVRKKSLQGKCMIIW